MGKNMPVLIPDAGDRVAIVTGGNSGRGLMIVKRLCQVFPGKIYFTARHPHMGKHAITHLNSVGCYPSFYHLDLTKEIKREKFAKYLNMTYGGIDILINNVGKRYLRDDKKSFDKTVSDFLNANLLYTLYLCQVLFQLLRPNARVVNLSSSCGFLSDIPYESFREKIVQDNFTDIVDMAKQFKTMLTNDNARKPGWRLEDAYCFSKMSLNILTENAQRHFNENCTQEGIIINSYSTSPVNIRRNESGPPVTTAESAVNIVKLATLPKNTINLAGKYIWPDMRIVNWKGDKPKY